MAGVIAVSNRSRKTERIAPCGAPLQTTRSRPLSGAPLHRRIERQLREGILAPWHLPLDEYDCEIERDYAPGSTTDGWFISRSEESRTATFTHRETGAKVIVTAIWVDDDGQILQSGSNYGDLTL
jgi:hypothetical protein